MNVHFRPSHFAINVNAQVNAQQNEPQRSSYRHLPAFLGGAAVLGALQHVYHHLPESSSLEVSPKVLMATGLGAATLTLSTLAYCVPEIGQGIAFTIGKAITVTNGIGRGLCSAFSGILRGVAATSDFIKEQVPFIPGAMVIATAAYVAANSQSQPTPQNF